MFLDSDGKMAGVIFGMMNFPGLRFVPTKKEKKKLDPFPSKEEKKKKKCWNRLLTLKDHGCFLKSFPFLCF